MDQTVNVNRKILATTVACILTEAGFHTSDKEALGTLTEMLQAFMCEVASTVRNYCELSSRTEPIIADVILAFVEIGFDFTGLPGFVKGGSHVVIPPLQPQPQVKMYNMLTAGTKQALPSYIGQHLPQFPDPHAYVRTPTHKQPIIDYESVREKAALQKRDIEKALTKFLSKTSPTHNLFDTEEANIFPLIACKPSYPPYLSALLPQDQIFDPEDLDTDPKMQIMQQQKDHDKATKNLKKKEPKGEHEEMDDSANDSMKSVDDTAATPIDNPYLAATKLPAGQQVVDLS